MSDMSDMSEAKYKICIIGQGNDFTIMFFLGKIYTYNEGYIWRTIDYNYDRNGSNFEYSDGSVNRDDIPIPDIRYYNEAELFQYNLVQDYTKYEDAEFIQKVQRFIIDNMNGIQRHRTDDNKFPGDDMYVHVVNGELVLGSNIPKTDENFQ